MHRLTAARAAYRSTAGSLGARLAIISSIESRFTTLSERERQVFEHVVAGLTNKQIARELGIAEVTVKLHRGSMTRKMDARSLVDLVRMWDALVRPI